MKRGCEKILTSKDGKRAIFIDSVNKDELKAYFFKDARHKKKFLHIVELILNGLKNSELYDKEDINDKCKSVTAMKFFKGQENDRVYCKEIRSIRGVSVVVASVLHEKKKGNNYQVRKSRK